MVTQPATSAGEPHAGAVRTGESRVGEARSAPRVADRIPPQNLDAEMALLGAMMMSRDAVAEVVPIIGRSDSRWFYVPAHQRLFEILLDMYDDPTKAIDLVVVSDELTRRDLLEAVGGEAYMVELAESYADWANAEHYARIVRDKGLLRDLIRCSGEISEMAYSAVDEARDILDRAEQKIFTATEKRVSGHAVELRETVQRLFNQLQEHGGGVRTGLTTGFVQLDDMTSGFQAGDMIVVAGRPSMGKTALGLTMAHYAAQHEHVPVAFFSMEMSADQVAQRLMCAQAGVDAQRFRRGLLSERDRRDLADACANLEHVPMLIDDTPGMTAMELRAKARRLKLTHGIGAVFVDYLQLMYSPHAESRQVEVSGISRNLKSLARELNVPVITMAQLNRMAEGRQNRRPLMSDLRESGAIEQDADVVLLIHREEYYKPEDEAVKGQADLIIAKQRNGPTGTVSLSFNAKLARFANRREGPEPDFDAALDDTVPY
ncbi:MAG: replicative DNA helicase [Phycisphaerae bacterium]